MESVHLGRDVRPKMWAEETLCLQVHLPAHQNGQLLLHAEEIEAGDSAGLGLQQEVDVALRSKIRTQRRAEHRKLTNMVRAAEGGKGDEVYVEGEDGHVHRVANARMLLNDPQPRHTNTTFR